MKPRQAKTSPKLKIRPVTASRWKDLEKLFGPRGACAGCWCMYWRLPHSQYKKQLGARNKRALKKIVASGAKPGLLAYADEEPVGWCATAPREDYPRLANSRTLGKVAERPVWSVVCFYIARRFRRRGVTQSLLTAAVEYARKRGAKIVEGYPVVPKTDRMPDTFAWTGLESAFRKAGFREVARRSPTRPIMRRSVGNF